MYSLKLQLLGNGQSRLSDLGILQIGRDRSCVIAIKRTSLKNSDHASEMRRGRRLQI